MENSEILVKDYIVVDTEYEGFNGTVGLLIADFDTQEEADKFIEENIDRLPGIKVFGPRA